MPPRFGRAAERPALTPEESADGQTAAPDGHGGGRMPRSPARRCACRRRELVVATPERRASQYRARHGQDAVHDAITDRVGDGGLADDLMPGRHRQPRHHQRRGSTVAIFEHLQQGQPRQCVQLLQGESSMISACLLIFSSSAHSCRQPWPGAVVRTAASTHGSRPGTRADTPDGPARRPGSSSRSRTCR